MNKTNGSNTFFLFLHIKKNFYLLSIHLFKPENYFKFKDRDFYFLKKYYSEHFYSKLNKSSIFFKLKLCSNISL